MLSPSLEGKFSLALVSFLAMVQLYSFESDSHLADPGICLFRMLLPNKAKRYCRSA